MKILINDYCGYPFQLDLSYELAKRGYQVYVTFTNASGGPKVLTNHIDDNLQIIDIKIPHVEKNNFFKRWFQESKYGEEVLNILESFNCQSKHISKLIEKIINQFLRVAVDWQHMGLLVKLII